MHQHLDIPHLAGRDAPLLELGFTPADAAWLTLVCFHSGVFTRRQYADALRTHRMAAHRLAHRLIAAGLAREHFIPDTTVRITHVYSRQLYRRLQIPNIRHRRNASRHVFLRRLLSLDHVANHLDLPWLPTEPDKVAYFTGRGVPRDALPFRYYAGAIAATRRYFPLKLPIAADPHSVTFLYADPDRDSQRELRTWADSHARLWSLLRDAGTSVHVAAITRDPAAQDAYARILDTWLTAAPSTGALTPDESSTLVALDAAIRAGDPDSLRPWGGFADARRLALRLRARVTEAPPEAHPSLRIDSFSTHAAPCLADDPLTT